MTILGEELEGLNSHNSVESSNPDIEVPIEHIQGDRKTNNVSFETTPDRIEKWKQAVSSYFGDSKVSTLKSGATLKVSLDSDDDKNGCVKINFYKTGSVVILGTKCSTFNEMYFSELKLRVDNVIPNNDSYWNRWNNPKNCWQFHDGFPCITSYKL